MGLIGLGVGSIDVRARWGDPAGIVAPMSGPMPARFYSLRALNWLSRKSTDARSWWP